MAGQQPPTKKRKPDSKESTEEEEEEATKTVYLLIEQESDVTSFHESDDSQLQSVDWVRTKEVVKSVFDDRAAAMQACDEANQSEFKGEPTVMSLSWIVRTMPTNQPPIHNIQTTPLIRLSSVMGSGFRESPDDCICYPFHTPGSTPYDNDETTEEEEEDMVDRVTRMKDNPSSAKDTKSVTAAVTHHPCERVYRCSQCSGYYFCDVHSCTMCKLPVCRNCTYEDDGRCRHCYLQYGTDKKHKRRMNQDLLVQWCEENRKPFPEWCVAVADK